MVDALRADHLGVNGYPRPTTPNIDLLASEGTNFTQAFAHSTWTKPSIATLFTSVYPGQHGLSQVAVDDGKRVGGEVLAGAWVTVAERFQAAGYFTLGIVNQAHITEPFGFAQGFDHFEAHRGKGAIRLNRRFKRWHNRQHETPQPLFVYMHYLDVHWPYIERVEALEEELGPLALTSRPPKTGSESVRQWGATLSPEDLAVLVNRYDHGIAYTDRQIGKLMSMLEEWTLLENTIVVITADHGEAFGEHGELLHGHAPYEEMIRVPLIFRLPERMRGQARTVDKTVGLIDVLPTLLDLAGLESEPQARGRSLRPLIRGEEIPARPAFAESESALAARSFDRKQIQFFDGRAQHFDLQLDPHELEPITASCDPSCVELRDQLAAYAEAMEIARAGIESEVVPLTDEDLEALRSLGYLD